MMLINFPVLISYSQQIFYPARASYLSAAQYAPETANAFTATLNPATLPFINNFTAGIASEKPYMLSELQLILLTAATNIHGNGVSGLFQYSGNPSFNQKLFSLNYGKSLGKVNVGAIFRYHLLNFSGSASMGTVEFGFSSLWHIADNVYTSFTITNPYFLFQDKNTIHAAGSSQMGIGYQASDKVYLGFEIDKEEKTKAHSLMMVSYRFEDKFYAKIYWSTGNNQPYFSTGIQLKNFKLEVGCSYHSVLGPSPCVAMYFEKQRVPEDL
jgi:hypothetical protein